jgi:hypothetical protein
MRHCNLKKNYDSFKVIKNSKQISTESFLKTLVHLFLRFSRENHSFLFYWGVSRLFGHTACYKVYKYKFI